MTRIEFSLSAAQDALARNDEGADPLPGDAELIAQYEGYLQSEAMRRDDEVRAQERAEWLVSQCPRCEDGGLGPVCDDHSAQTQDEVREILTRALKAEVEARAAFLALGGPAGRALLDAQDLVDAAVRAFFLTLPRLHRVGIAWNATERRWLGACIEPDCDFTEFGADGASPGEVLVAATQHHAVDLP